MKLFRIQDLTIQDEQPPLTKSMLPATTDTDNALLDPIDTVPPLQSSGSAPDASLICSTLNFNINDLKARRQQRMSKLRTVSRSSETMKMKGYLSFTV